MIFQSLNQNSLDHAWSIGHLGIIKHKNLNLKAAKRSLEKSYRIFSQYFDNNHFIVAWVNIFRGRLYIDLGRYEESKRLLEHSLRVYKKKYGTEHNKLGKIYRYLGVLYCDLNDFDKSMYYLRIASNIYRDNKNPQLYACLESMADLYIKRYYSEYNSKKQRIFRAKAYQLLKDSEALLDKFFSVATSHKQRIRNKFKLL